MVYKSQKPSVQSRRKQEQRKKRMRRRRILVCLFIIAAFLLGFILGKRTRQTKDTFSPAAKSSAVVNQKSTEKQITARAEGSVTVVPAPQDYSYEEAISVLAEQAKSNGKYDTILSNPRGYPEGLITGLANNPELLDFVSGYLENEGTGSKTISSQEAKEKAPLFLQWDKRWGATDYGDNIMAISGCGPTALSMVIVGLTHNSSASPAQVASFAMENGYYMYGTGTMWSLMTEGAASYDLSSTPIDVDHDTMQQQLDQGAYLICSMKSGDFTANGHFIVIYGSDSSGFLINDPFCKYRSSITWTYDQLQSQIKSMWSLKSR